MEWNGFRIPAARAQRAQGRATERGSEHEQQSSFGNLIPISFSVYLMSSRYAVEALRIFGYEHYCMMYLLSSLTRYEVVCGAVLLPRSARLGQSGGNTCPRPKAIKTRVTAFINELGEHAQLKCAPLVRGLWARDANLDPAEVSTPGLFQNKGRFRDVPS